MRLKKPEVKLYGKKYVICQMVVLCCRIYKTECLGVPVPCILYLLPCNPGSPGGPTPRAAGLLGYMVYCSACDYCRQLLLGSAHLRAQQIFIFLPTTDHLIKGSHYRLRTGMTVGSTRYGQGIPWHRVSPTTPL